MASTDPYYTVDVDKVEIVRLRRDPHWWVQTGERKCYIESHGGRQRQLLDSDVFRNERDAAIALARRLLVRVNGHVAKAQTIQKAAMVVIQQHDIADCPYLVSDGDL